MAPDLLRKGSHTLDKWFLWKYTMTFPGLLSRACLVVRLNTNRVFFFRCETMGSRARGWSCGRNVVEAALTCGVESARKRFPQSTNFRQWRWKEQKTNVTLVFYLCRVILSFWCAAAFSMVRRATTFSRVRSLEAIRGGQSKFLGQLVQRTVQKDKLTQSKLRTKIAGQNLECPVFWVRCDLPS